MTHAIAIDDVTKAYGTGAMVTHALRGVSLDVHTGEVLLMEGPSGSGKTTLLSIMGAILRPTSGRVIIGGHDVALLPERDLPGVRLRHLGFVFQGFNLFPALSAIENVSIALDVRGERGPGAARLAARALEAVGLSDKARALPRDLSGGQKQRVAIARALVGEPRIILADEPTASLDAESGGRVMQLLRSLATDDGRAVVIVTHDSRTFGYADRVVRIDDGRLTEDVPPARAAGRAPIAGGDRAAAPTRPLQHAMLMEMSV
jgi:putative ABC transport system ATP-binding protein